MTNPICALDWQRKQVFRGRLALALAGLRAGRCRNPGCGRARHCLAEIRTKGIHDPCGDCPVMSEAEWQAVAIGMGRVRESSRGWYRVQDAAAEAALKQLSKERRAEVEAWGKEWAASQAKAPWVPYYWDLLWTELVGEIVQTTVTAAEVAKAERQLIETARESGCVCAKDGMREC